MKQSSIRSRENNPNMPCVSIGLPVFNGELYLRDALESLLNQSLTDIELIIGDNGSTDGTAEICKSFAAQDSRIRYFRHEGNRGAAYNFNFVFQKAISPYFKWASNDDVCAPEFLAQCVSVLDTEHDIVLCHTKTGIIDAKGNRVGDDSFELRLDSHSVSERFYDLAVVRHPCFLIFGVVRTEVLRKTSLIGNYVGSDRVLLSEIALHGRMWEGPERLFLRRCHSQTSVRLDARKELLYWFDPDRYGKITYPNWRILRELIAAVNRSPLPRSTRISCYGPIVHHMSKRRYHLRRDLTEAVKLHMRRTSVGEKLFKSLKRILKPKNA